MTEPDRTRVHIVISGVVQGVFFRHHTRKNALRLGLTGWVKNLPDGRVEAVFEGEASQVTQMIEWCRTGPPAARISDIALIHEEATGRFSDFEIVFD